MSMECTLNVHNVHYTTNLRPPPHAPDTPRYNALENTISRIHRPSSPSRAPQRLRTLS
jgi:hypothetical protein